MILPMALAVSVEELEQSKNWEKGIQDGYVIVGDKPWWKIFSISTMAGNEYNYDFITGQIVTFRTDPTTWSLSCNDAQVVVEIYDPSDNFYDAVYSERIINRINGNTYLLYDLDWHVPSSAPLGRYEAVNYVVCLQANSAKYQQLISNADTVNFNVATQPNEPQCDEWTSAEHCDGNGNWIKQQHGLVGEQCKTTTIIVDDCSDTEYCDPQKGGCYEKESDDNGNAGTTPDADDDSGSTGGSSGNNYWLYGIIGIVIIVLVVGLYLFLEKK